MWSAVRMGGLGVVLASTCSVDYEPVVGVIAPRSADDVRRSTREIDGRIVGTATLSVGRGPEVLVAERYGLLAVGADGERDLFEVFGPSAAAIAPLSESEALVFVITASDDRQLLALRCNERSCGEEHVEGIDDAMGALAVGDITEDGVVDLLAWGDGRVELRVGRTLAGGAFDWLEPVRYAEVGAWSNFSGRQLAVADLDDDGHLDVVAVRQSGGVAVLYGGGGSRPVDRVFLEQVSRDVETSDLDADGLVDIIGADVVHLNLGDRTFESLEVPSSGDLIAVGRFTADRPQLMDVSVDRVSGEVQIHTLTAARTWESTSVFIGEGEGDAEDGESTWTVVDFDGDGRDEVLFTEWVDERLRCG